MKNIILTLGLVAVAAFSTLAAGILPNNATQSGVIAFNGATGLIYTNTFPAPYLETPVVTYFTSTTSNCYPSAISVTTTNFILTVTNGATATNASVAWTASLGVTRIQTGTVYTTNGVVTAVTFPTPYAYAPTVVAVNGLSLLTTNSIIGGAIQLPPSLVTTTGFSISTFTQQTNQWIAVGTVPASNAGSQNVTQ